MADARESVVTNAPREHMMVDMTSQPEQWTRWVEKTCAALDLDPSDVDIPLVHELSKNVSHEVTRPLAPVSSYILGIAIGRLIERGEVVDADARRELAQRIPLTD